MNFDDEDDDYNEYENFDDDYLDVDYITCSVCGLVVLRSEDSRARENHCCQDCYYDVIVVNEF